MGKRCIGNQWRCKCVLRPMSMVALRAVKPGDHAPTDETQLSPADALAAGER